LDFGLKIIRIEEDVNLGIGEFRKRPIQEFRN
jgi:hypothetical protein